MADDIACICMTRKRAKAKAAQSEAAETQTEQNGGASTTSGTEPEAAEQPTPASFRSRLDAKVAIWLDDMRIQLALRSIYLLLSSYGSYAMIQEHPQRIFYGFNAFLIIVFYLLNALFAFTVSNREIRIVWVSLRSFSSWRFFLAFWQVYPTHAYRLAAIAATAGLYAYFLPWDRIASVALVASLVLVACDTPKLRKVVWEGENSRLVQIGLAGCAAIFLGGFRIYRWAALAALYIAQNLLLGATNFVPSASQADLHQSWLAGASVPGILVYHFSSVGGASRWTAMVYTVLMLILTRPNSPSRDIKLVRTLTVAASGVLLELVLFGIGTRFAVLAAGLVIYGFTLE